MMEDGLLALTRETLDGAVREHELLVVAVGANVAHLQALKPTDPRVRLAHIAPAAGPSVAAMLGLEEAAALVIFGRQVILYAESGEHQPGQIAALVARVCELDLDRIMAEIEEEKQAELALRMRRVCPTARRGGPAG